MRKLVEVANALAASLGRSLDWIHMPVPRDRADDAYFAPLASLRLQPQTELYLGVIHRDGRSGERIAAAQRHFAGFGAATDCGWGRGGTAAVDELLALHRECSQPLPAAVRGSGGGGFTWPEGFVPVLEEDVDGRADRQDRARLRPRRPARLVLEPRPDRRRRSRRSCATATS